MRTAHTIRQRRGTVLIATLVCMIVVTGILGAMLRGTLRERRQLHVERDRRQTELLLQAGADRAAFQLAREADYAGEIWKLPADAIVGGGEATVTIKAPRDGENNARNVQVVAEYRVASSRAIRRSKVFTIQPSISKPKE